MSRDEVFRCHHDRYFFLETVAAVVEELEPVVGAVVEELEPVVGAEVHFRHSGPE